MGSFLFIAPLCVKEKGWFGGVVSDGGQSGSLTACLCEGRMVLHGVKYRLGRARNV